MQETMNGNEVDTIIDLEENLIKYDGEAVYFNPSTGVKCNDTEVVSITGTKSVCMTFYAFLDSEDSSTVNLILDHNTTDYVEWNSDGTATTPKEVITTLESDTTRWKQIVNDVETTLTGRLITAAEVNEIAPLTPFNYEENGDMVQVIILM